MDRVLVRFEAERGDVVGGGREEKEPELGADKVFQEPPKRCENRVECEQLRWLSKQSFGFPFLLADTQLALSLCH